MADTKLDGRKILLVIPQTQFREEEVFEPKRIVSNPASHDTAPIARLLRRWGFITLAAQKRDPS